jgi:hypothetical protein
MKAVQNDGRAGFFCLVGLLAHSAVQGVCGNLPQIALVIHFVDFALDFATLSSKG